MMAIQGSNDDSDEWVLVFKLKWAYWVPASFARVFPVGVVALSFAGVIILLTAAAVGGLLGLLPPEASGLARGISGMRWYELSLSVALFLFGVYFVWALGRESVAGLLDLLTPGVDYQARVEEVECRRGPGIGWDHLRHWELTLAGEAWPLLISAAPDVRVGKQVRLRYRRGSKTVTHIWRERQSDAGGGPQPPDDNHGMRAGRNV